VLPSLSQTLDLENFTNEPRQYIKFVSLSKRASTFVYNTIYSRNKVHRTGPSAAAEISVYFYAARTRNRSRIVAREYAQTETAEDGSFVGKTTDDCS